MDIENIRVQWKKSSRTFLVAAFLVFFLAGVFTVYDFYSVVLNWLISGESELRTTLTTPILVTLSHPTYEFDWSVAALFDGATVGRMPNAIFAGVAYFVIPFIGAGGLLAGFFWFFSVSAFFSSGNLKKLGVIIVPDTASGDDRAGFEVFEGLLDSLLKAGIFTAVLALGMHLQNVYLRAPGEPNIFHMVFSGLREAIQPAFELNFQPLANFIMRIDHVLEMEVRALSVQTYVSAVVLMLLAFIVIFSVWHYLRENVVLGRAWLIHNTELSAEETQKLESMKIWPVGWISVNITLLAGFLLIVSMVFVNVLGLLIVAGSVWAMGVLLRGAVSGLFSRGTR